jgi:hypothetical protein
VRALPPLLGLLCRLGFLGKVEVVKLNECRRARTCPRRVSLWCFDVESSIWGQSASIPLMQTGKPLADLPIPESYRWLPPAVPARSPFNVAQLFMWMGEGIRKGKSVSPDFDVAVKRHQLLDAIQKASDTGIRQIL